MTALAFNPRTNLFLSIQRLSAIVSEPTTSGRADFRACVAEHKALLIAGAVNAMSARIIKDTGFEAVCLAERA